MNKTILAIEKLSTRLSKIEKRLDKFENPKETKQEIPAKTIYWGETSQKEMNWEEAKRWCEEQGGRMPTLIELQQAYEDKVDGFKEDYYWSATEHNSTYAYYVNFTNGLTYLNNRTSASYVRCIRR